MTPAAARPRSRPSAEAAAPGWPTRIASLPVASGLVFVLALVVFANTLGHGFVWDDTVLLDQKVRFYGSGLDAWHEPPGLPNMRMYRPLELWSLWLDRRLWSSSTGFHATQVVLHAVNGVLVLWLAHALGAPPLAALVAAAFFVVHPVVVESVAWLTCRADVLTGTFAAVAMLLYLRHQRVPAWWTIPATAVASFLATASKETGTVVPLLLAAAVAVVPRPAGPLAFRIRRAWPLLLASVVGVALCHGLRPADVTTGIGRTAFGWHDVVQLTGAFSYQLARVLAPIGFAPYVPATPTDTAHLALALLGGAALLAAIVAASPDGVRRLGALWFVIAVAPAVAVVLADFTVTPVAERRLYLGMIGMALLVASLPLERRAVAAASALVLASLAATTVARNRLWHDELTLWTAVTERVQTDPLPYLNLGLALADAGRAREAEAAYRRALALDPTDVTRQRASIDLGLILVGRDALDEAAALFSAANAIGEHAIAHRGLGMIARKRGQAALRAGDAATANTELNRALAELNQALAINPRYPQAYLTLGGVLYDAGQYRDALAQYERAAALAGDGAVGREAAGAASQLGAWIAAHPEAR